MAIINQDDDTIKVETFLTYLKSPTRTLQYTSHRNFENKFETNYVITYGCMSVFRCLDTFHIIRQPIRQKLFRIKFLK